MKTHTACRLQKPGPDGEPVECGRPVWMNGICLRCAAASKVPEAVAEMTARFAAKARPGRWGAFWEFREKYTPYPIPIAWRAAAKALEGVEMDAAELDAFEQIAGHREPPDPGGVELFLAVIGRGGAKTSFLADFQLFTALNAADHFAHLPPGSQLGGAMVAGTIRQARIGFRHIEGALRRHKEIRAEVVGKPTMRDGIGTITFKSGYTIETYALSKSSTRGARLALVTLDESAWIPTSEQSVNQDIEVVAALTGSLIAPAGAPPRRFLAATSAGAKKGWVWETYSSYGGKPHPHVLVIRGATRLFNPSISEAQLERIRERDPQKFAREYLYDFADSISNWIDSTFISSAARESDAPLMPKPGVVGFGGVDMSFKRDAAAAAVGHTETTPEGEPRLVIDVVDRVVPAGRPLDAPTLVARFAALFKRYGVARVYGDQFAAIPLAGEFRRHGIELVEETATNRSKLEHFGRLKEMFYAHRVSLPKHEKLLEEFRNLQERITGAGNIQIDHPNGGSSDCACAVTWCSAALVLGGEPSTAELWLRAYGITPEGYGSDPEDDYNRHLVANWLRH